MLNLGEEYTAFYNIMTSNLYILDILHSKNKVQNVNYFQVHAKCSPRRRDINKSKEMERTEGCKEYSLTVTDRKGSSRVEAI